MKVNLIINISKKPFYILSNNNLTVFNEFSIDKTDNVLKKQ